MKKYVYIAATFVFLGVVTLVMMIGFRSVTPAGNRVEAKQADMNMTQMHLEPGEALQLPEPVLDGDMSLEKALTLRRSIRQYTNEPLTLSELSQLLWSAQGITDSQGLRTAPSAGATYPLELYIMVNRVEGLHKGIYHYMVHDHQLAFLRATDMANDLARACLNQSMIAEGGAVLIFVADFERTTERYGERGVRFVYNEIGHASQNVYLQAAVLQLGTVVIGAYHDDEVEELLQLDEPYRVLYLMPVGRQ